MSINHYDYSSEFPEDQCQWWSPYLMESPPAKTSSSFLHQFHISHPHLISSHSNTNPTTTTTSAAAFWLNPHLYHHPTAPSTMFCPQNTAFSFNLNNDDADENNSTTSSGKEVQPPLRQVQDQEDEIPKEPLFEKPLTPSDVGKLNRLVIPKQHAEKHFPLSGEKGLLLSFEDEVGKPWRFRYSYWNSSQSYVLTKGWSRFVKEKRLDAGDAVVFTRHRVDGGRFFIGWRRRNSTSDAFGGGNITSGGPGWGRAAADYSSQRRQQNYHKAKDASSSPQPPYRPESVKTGSVLIQNQTATVNGNNNNNNSRRLRLFGVNLDFPANESEPSTPDDPTVSQSHPYLHHYYSSHHNYMDINFSRGGDAYRQG